MDWHEMNDAVEDAKTTIRLGDTAARRTASLLVGRLRLAQISTGTCARLKRELRTFNMTTGEWNDD